MSGAIEGKMSDQTFTRLSVSERGHTASRFELLPVKRIAFDATGLEISTLLRRERIAYADLSARVLRTHAHKDGFRVTRRPLRVPQTLVTLSAPTRAYTIDLSYHYGDFADGKRILELIRSRVRTTAEVETRDSADRRLALRHGLMLIPVLLLVAYAVAQALR
jgi:hypothetical protein